VEILEAYDLTGSYRAAAELVGCDHHTVARYVRLRDAGRGPDERVRREQLVDAWPGEAGGVGGALRRARRRRRRLRQADGDGVCGLGADHPAGGRGGQAQLPGGAPAGVPPLAARAGPVAGSSTGAPAPRSPAGRCGCGARGWRGRGFGCCPRGTARCPACWAAWTPRCAGSAGCRPTRFRITRRPSPSSTWRGCRCATPTSWRRGGTTGWRSAPARRPTRSRRAARRQPCGWPSGTWSPPGPTCASATPPSPSSRRPARGSAGWSTPARTG
jgi:hypothetical protein